MRVHSNYYYISELEMMMIIIEHTWGAVTSRNEHKTYNSYLTGIN